MKNQRSKFSHIWGSEFLTKLLLFCCFLGISAFASAQQKVTGKVVDSNGQPIIGASVVVKGSSTGVITDIDGVFLLYGRCRKDNRSDLRWLQVKDLQVIRQTDGDQARRGF